MCSTLPPCGWVDTQQAKTPINLLARLPNRFGDVRDVASMLFEQSDDLVFAENAGDFDGR